MDSWGRDPAVVRALDPALAVASRWWRLHVEGVERVPAEGGVLIVANGGGAFPWAPLLIARALPRPARLLADPRVFSLPFLTVAARRLGAVPAHDANAERALAEGEVVVAVLPRGRGGPYEVGRFDLAAVAVAAGAPVVPCAVVGPEEAGVVPWPVRWRIEFGDAIDLRTYRPTQATDAAALLEGAETVRDRIQAMVHDNLVRREGALF
jgi:1-acyl-sn-glycerol-3-phosphate acyltransferase